MKPLGSLAVIALIVALGWFVLRTYVLVPSCHPGVEVANMEATMDQPSGFRRTTVERDWLFRCKSTREYVRIWNNHDGTVDWVVETTISTYGPGGFQKKREVIRQP